MITDYTTLSTKIRQAGLMERQYTYYAIKFTIIAFLLSLSIFFVVTNDNFLIQSLIAIFLAFVFIQFALLMHDADHNQIFKSRRFNMLTGRLIGNVVLHTSSDAWNKNHNKHHSSPNTVDEDPDIAIPLLVHSETKARETKGLMKYIVRYQAFYWFPLLMIMSLSMRLNYLIAVIVNLRKNITNRLFFHYLLEISLLVVGLILYFGGIIYFIGGWQAFAFIVINYAASGLYMGTIFATNHKGMPIIEGKKPDFITLQIMTTRNVKRHPIVDYWTGGLNFQIEHHLFPSMPRNNLSKATVLIKQFCRDNDIEYNETGFYRSYKEILQNFHRVSSVLRNKHKESAN